MLEENHQHSKGLQKLKPQVNSFWFVFFHCNSHSKDFPLKVSWQTSYKITCAAICRNSYFCSTQLLPFARPHYLRITLAKPTVKIWDFPSQNHLNIPQNIFLTFLSNLVWQTRGQVIKEEARLKVTTYFTISYVRLFAASSYHHNPVQNTSVAI